jgi:hypothetical protein
MIIAECEINLKLHSGSGNNIIHNNFLSNSWISAFVREKCTDCYIEGRNTINSRCSNVNGI